MLHFSSQFWGSLQGHCARASPATTSVWVVLAWIWGVFVNRRQKSMKKSPKRVRVWV